MDPAFILIITSIALQIVSAFFAAKMIMVPDRRLAGLITSLIILLMAFRRFVSFYRLMSGGTIQTDLFAESLALVISFLILLAVLYISGLIRSERKGAAILGLIPDAVCSIDTEQRIITWNEGAERMLGFKAGEILGKPVQTIIPEEAGAGLIKRLDILAKGETLTGHEELRKSKDGRIVIVELSGFAVREGKRITGYVLIMRDITERRTSENLIKNSLSSLRATLDATSDGILVVSDQGRITNFNDQFIKMWGLPDEVLNSHEDQQAVDFVLDQLKNPGQFVAKVREVYAIPESTSFDLLEFKDGRIVERYSRPQVVDGQPVGRVWSFRDVTERSKTENALKNSEARLNTILENVGAAIFIKDLKGRYTYVNPRVCEIFGRHEADILGHTDLDFFSPDSVEVVLRNDRQVLQNGETVTREELALVCADNKPRTYWTVKLPLRDSAGGIVGLCGISTDITERKRSEDLLIASLREKEVLLRELSHRTKNNMQVIASLITLQALKVTDPQLLKITKDTESRINAMALVHEKLYNTGDFANIDIRNYIKDLTMSLLSGYLKDPKQVSLVIDVDDGRISIDTALPCGLLINELMTNSLKYAFPEGRKGEITLSIHSEKETGETEIRLKDNGIGLPEGFDITSTPTTGLQIAASLAENQLNGTFDVLVNGGTEFVVKFHEPSPSQGKI